MNIKERLLRLEHGWWPATQIVLEDEEHKLGFKLPPILREIYTNVANGGIGPGYQIIGLKGGYTSEEGFCLVELYKSMASPHPDDPEWKWPKGLVPFCHWGCGIYSCFDAFQKDNPVQWFDPTIRELGEPMDTQFQSHKPSLELWFESWVIGEDMWAETFG